LYANLQIKTMMNSQAKIKKAISISDIYQSFRYLPLQINELDQLYVETDKVRGGVPVRKRIARLLERNIDENHQILMVGYKGCGKSTELNHLQKDLQNDFLVMNYSVMTELDPIHLNYIELFIVTLEQLFTLAQKYEINISKEYIDNITHWMQTKEIQEIREKYNIGIEGEAGAKGQVGIPYLQSFFYKFKMSAKSSRSLKETLKTNIEPKLSDLIEHCNLLINEIRFSLPGINKKDLLIIIEDLDKIPVDRADDLFFNYANQITQLNTNIVFTFPITAYYHIRFNTIKPYFSQVMELPMIKIHNPDQSEFNPGIDLLIKIVERRMDLSLFESIVLLRSLIEKSGGCIRDLFRLISEAAEQAIDFGRDKINTGDCKSSIASLKRDYENTIADNYHNGELITADTYYKALASIAASSLKKLDNTIEQLDLRQNLCLLGYNGEGWCDVHPIVKDILIEKKKWDGKQK